MNKSLRFLVILLVLILVGLSVFLLKIIFVSDETPVPVLNITLELQNNTVNPAFCANMTNLTQRTDCYFSMAVKQKNASICKEIEDSWDKGDCFLLAGK